MPISIDLGLGKLATAIREGFAMGGSKKRRRRAEDAVAIVLRSLLGRSGQDLTKGRLAARAATILKGWVEWPMFIEQPPRRERRAADRMEYGELYEIAEKLLETGLE